MRDLWIDAVWLTLAVTVAIVVGRAHWSRARSSGNPRVKGGHVKH